MKNDNNQYSSNSYRYQRIGRDSRHCHKEAVDVTTSARATLPCVNLHPVRRHLLGGDVSGH